MGTTFSKSARQKSKDEPVVSSDEEDDEDIRPAKRRKTSTFNNPSSLSFDDVSPRRKPLGHVTNDSRRAASASRLPKKIQSSNFYGRSSSTAPGGVENSKPKPLELKRSRTSIGSIVPENVLDFKRALRVEILGIVPKSAAEAETLKFTRGHQSPIETRCRCSVGLFCAKDDNYPPTHLSNADYFEVSRLSRFCSLRTAFDEEGNISRELNIAEPFILTERDFYVNRNKASPNGEFQDSVDFADKYYIQVTLEPWVTKGPKNWPPFDIPTDMGSADGDSSKSGPVTELLFLGKNKPNQVHLCCNMQGVLEPDRQFRAADLKLSLSNGQVKQKIAYAFQLRTQWSLPDKYCDLATRVPDIEPPRTVGAFSNNDMVPASPLARKPGDSLAPESPADGRASRRRSNVPTYNLKTLSTLAQGKSPRKRQIFRSRSLHSSEDSDAITVTWTFGKADAADLGMKQSCTTGLMCPFCNRHQRCLEDLRLHLHTNHTNFKFSLRRNQTARVGFHIELVKGGSRSSPIERARTLQLSKPQTLFDLEKFLSGDDSWLKPREGPQNHYLPEHLMDRLHESSLSSSPHDSRHSSPNTSNDTDGVMDMENYQHKLAVRTRKKFYVPKTSKPLYDTITKQVLQPGEEIPDSDEEKDEGWLHQKHRDIINDFTDVTEEEKDYITRWNPFITTEHLTCENYLPEACLRFAEANASWFAKRPSRKIEFGKQMETFIMRGVVPQNVLDKCVDFLRRAEEQDKDVDMGDAEDRPISPSRQRGMFDCVCGGLTQPPDRVICRGPTCQGRFFHQGCAKESKRPIREVAWFCDHCVS